MGYTKQTWVNNDPSKPLDANRLNHIEDGVFVAEATADSAAGGVTALNALTTSGRLSEDALNTTIVESAVSVSEMLEVQPMWVTGHSWQASTAATTSGGRWFERLVRRAYMGTVTNKAQSGRTIGDIAMATLGGANAWVPRTKSLIGVACTINDVTLFDGSAAARRGYAHAWKALLTLLTANGAVAADTDKFVYSSSTDWAAVPVTPSLDQAAGVSATGSSWWRTTTTGQYFEFTFAGTAVDVVLIARAAGAGLVTFTEGGTARGTLDLTSATAQDTPAVHRITGLSAGTHTIRGTLTSGASLTVDSYRVPSTAPAPIVVLGEPPVIPTVDDMPGYVAEVEYEKTVLAGIVATFPSAIYVDLTRDGWDQETMLVADGKHPNDFGAAWIATQVYKALSALPYSGGLGTTLNQDYPAAYTAPAGPSVPGGGVAGDYVAPPPAVIPSGYAARYKASSVAGSDGTAVTSWADDGPSGVAYASANGPTLRTSPYNYLEFDGSNDFLSRAAFATVPSTRLLVGRIRTLAGGTSQIFLGGNASGQTIGKSSAGNWIANNGAVLDSGVAATTDWVVLGVVFNGATSYLTLNGDPVVTGDSGSTTTPATSYIARTTTSVYQTIDLAEVIVYTSALTSAELRGAALKLMDDYGL